MSDAAPGARRDDDALDDDALAAAIEATYTSSIPIPTARSAYHPGSELDDEPEAVPEPEPPASPVDPSAAPWTAYPPPQPDDAPDEGDDAPPTEMTEPVSRSSESVVDDRRWEHAPPPMPSFTGAGFADRLPPDGAEPSVFAAPETAVDPTGPDVSDPSPVAPEPSSGEPAVAWPAWAARDDRADRFDQSGQSGRSDPEPADDGPPVWDLGESPAGTSPDFASVPRFEDAPDFVAQPPAPDQPTPWREFPAPEAESLHTDGETWHLDSDEPVGPFDPKPFPGFDTASWTTLVPPEPASPEPDADAESPLPPPDPDAPARDFTVPDPAVPDAVLPDAVLPVAVLPDAVQPEAVLPDAAVPDAVAPDSEVPSFPIPTFSTGDFANAGGPLAPQGPPIAEDVLSEYPAADPAPELTEPSVTGAPETADYKQGVSDDRLEEATRVPLYDLASAPPPDPAAAVDQARVVSPPPLAESPEPSPGTDRLGDPLPVVAEPPPLADPPPLVEPPEPAPSAPSTGGLHLPDWTVGGAPTDDRPAESAAAESAAAEGESPEAPHSDEVPPPPLSLVDETLSPASTGDAEYRDEDDGSVDPEDRVLSLASSSISAVPATSAAHPEPIAGLTSPAPVIPPPVLPPSAGRIETAGIEPTALDRRAGRSARLFWLWFAAGASLLSFGIGALLPTLGMSLRQAVVAVLVGVALSFLPLGLGTLAGKWSGQPTLVVSRATFGLVGNALPVILALISRAVLGGILLWLLADSAAGAAIEAGLGGDGTVIGVIAVVVAVLLVALVVVIGYGLLARVQLVLSSVGAVLVVVLIVITAPSVDLGIALSVGDGPWILVLSGATLVFSFVGLAWAQTGADVARYQSPDGQGSSNMVWASLGATVPALLLLTWGALLAASDPGFAAAASRSPVTALAGLLPAWYPVPLLVLAVVGAFAGAVLAAYSGGFALLALGAAVPRAVGAGVTAALAGAIALILVTTGAGTMELGRDVITTMAVPVAAWAGIFGAEMMIRQRRFHTPSLLTRGGVYPDVRVINLVALMVITVIGFGLTGAASAGLAWQGYLLRVFGVEAGSDLAGSDLGVLVALVLGLAVPLATAVPVIRRQESVRA